MNNYPRKWKEGRGEIDTSEILQAGSLVSLSQMKSSPPDMDATRLVFYYQKYVSIIVKHILDLNFLSRSFLFL